MPPLAIFWMEETTFKLYLNQRSLFFSQSALAISVDFFYQSVVLDPIRYFPYRENKKVKDDKEYDRT